MAVVSVTEHGERRSPSSGPPPSIFHVLAGWFPGTECNLDPDVLKACQNLDAMLGTDISLEADDSGFVQGFESAVTAANRFSEQIEHVGYDPGVCTGDPCTCDMTALMVSGCPAMKKGGGR